MKIHLIISFLIFNQVLIAQKIANKSNIEEHNFFYSDSANNEFAYGDYEPKDIIQLNDGSYLIGTELSISYPSQYKSPKEYDSIYFAKSQVFQKKSHVSSGTIFKLSSNFKKEWETIFKGQRIEKIFMTSDDRILIVGEEVSMKYVWMAEIDITGNIKWQKEFKYKNQVTIANALIDNNNDIYLLLEASHVIPIQINKYYGRRRIQFFKDSEINSHIALLKVSSSGNKKWLKPIDKRKKYNKFGYEIITNQESIFASYTYSGFVKDSLIKGKKLIELSKSRKKIHSKELANQDILLFEDGLVTIESNSKGTIKLYKSRELIDSININNAKREVKIGNVIKMDNGYVVIGSNHNSRDHLLINLSSEFKFLDYLYYKREGYNEIRGALTLANGDIIVIGKCYKRKGKEAHNELIMYINLVKIRNGS